MTENTLTRDGDFSLEKLLERTNDFSDIYGNLVMRSLGKNIAGPVLERGVGTVQASEETRDRLRHLKMELPISMTMFCFQRDTN